MNSVRNTSTLRPSDDEEVAQMHGRPTPEVILGPFYPADRVAPRRSDLRFVDGGQAVAIGKPILVSVRVVNSHGTGLDGVYVEFWQANSNGRYRHPGDHGAGALDPAFDGFASQVTDQSGLLMFKTVKPGPYQTPWSEWRAPHIHFQVTSGPLRLITQMFFPGEPLNDKDRCLHSCRQPKMLVAKAVDPPPTSMAEVEWVIVLPS